MNDTEPRKLTAIYERDRDGYWLVELADEPRVHSFGRTLTKARAHIVDAAALWYEVEPDRLVVVDDVRIPPSVLAAVDAARAARILDGLRGEGEDPILVLWALSRETRQMAKIQVSVQAGTPATQAMRAAGVWDSRQALVGKALRRLPLPRLQEALKRAADIDRMVKGLLKGDVWDELLQLGLSLAH